eukprot:15461774-Alexandrium_andersonii.AAC.1
MQGGRERRKGDQGAGQEAWREGAGHDDERAGSAGDVLLAQGRQESTQDGPQMDGAGEGGRESVGGGR